MKTFLGQVIALVSDAFKDVTDKSGQPYILHCFAVMEGARHRGITCQFELAAAFAHDLCEDKPHRMIELASICSQYDGAKKTCEWVGHLSRRHQETYHEFITRIIDHNLINLIKIKQADIEHNSLVTRLKGVTDNDISRMKKYSISYLELDAARKLMENN